MNGGIDAVIVRMQEIDRALPRKDGVAYFNRLYLQVTKADLQTTVNSAVALLEAKIESQSLRLTIRLGGIVAVGIAILAAILKLG